MFKKIVFKVASRNTISEPKLESCFLNVPYHSAIVDSLQDRLKVTPSADEMPTVKKSRPFCLSNELEMSLVSYCIKMQEYDFDLSATDVRQEAFKLSSYECSSFNSEKGGAGWDWWLGFKARSGSV